MNPNRAYSIDDILQDNPVTRALNEPVPAAMATSFGDGVDPGAIGSGEMEGNVTIGDGYLQSENYVAGSVGWRLTPTGGDFNFSIQADEVHVPDEDTTSNSFHVDSDGDMWVGATTTAFNADNDNAAAYILKDGIAKFQSITLSGSVVIEEVSAGSVPAIQGWQFDGAFSASDSNTVAWAAGTLTFANGETRSIGGGNTGNMAARTYIYYDEDVSTTAFQTTTTASNAVGKNKILIGIAENSSQEANYQIYGGIGGGKWNGTDLENLSVDSGQIATSAVIEAKLANSAVTTDKVDALAITAAKIAAGAIETDKLDANAVTAAKIAANTITANEISANTITANEIAANTITASEIQASTITATEMNVSQLSAVAADMGSITAGDITLDTSGFIKGGQTAYDTGTGFFLGYSGGAYKFSIGNASGNKLTWDGTTLVVAGTTTDIQSFTSSGTWTKPSFGSIAIIQVWGGGGSGACYLTDISREIGGGGGGGYAELIVPLSDLGATETVTIGSGGAGVSTSATNGNAGGNTTFGSVLTAYGGGGGSYDPSGAGGGGGGSVIAAGGNASTTSAGAAGGYDATSGGDASGAPAKAFSGAGGGAAANGANGQNGGNSINGGAGGGGVGNGNAGNGGTSLNGGNGGAGEYSASGAADATDGSQPGGGGGAKGSTSGSGSSGAGGDGMVVITVI